MPAAALDNRQLKLSDFVAMRRGKIADRRPPGLMNGRLAAGQWHRLQPGVTFKRARLADEHLAAPNRAIGSVTRAVEDDADGFLGHVVFSHHRRQMRVMMLDAEARHVRLLQSPFGREILGMQVEGNQLWLNF